MHGGRTHSTSSIAGAVFIHFVNELRMNVSAEGKRQTIIHFDCKPIALKKKAEEVVVAAKVRILINIAHTQRWPLH